MSDAVIDTTVVALSNVRLTCLKEGSNLHARIRLLKQCYAGERRIRFNGRLRAEYDSKVSGIENDFVRLFFELLDSSRSIFVKKSTLSRQFYDRARNDCGWPGHDQHILAAGVGGEQVVLFVTEERHCNCRAAIKRVFDFNLVRMRK